MLNIVNLIDYLYSNDYIQFFKMFNYYKINNNEFIEIYEEIKWYYLFNDFEMARKKGIKLIKLIHNNNEYFNNN